MSDDNPIDKDKITENPGLIPYPHHIGSPSFKPMNKGDAKSKALTSMREQANLQLDQLKEQMELLANQAKKLENRVLISEKIYQADTSFEPVVNSIYYLYARDENDFVLSMVAPDEWGRKIPFTHYVASVRLLGDHTWDVLETAEEAEFPEKEES